MRYGSDRYRYGGGDTPETTDAEFAGRVEYVGLEPAFGSGYLTAFQMVGVTITDVRRGSGVSVGDYLDLDVAVVDGARHVVPGSMNPDVRALDPAMIQPGVTLVAWANATDSRWQAIDVSTDGPVPAANYAGRSRGGDRYGSGGYPGDRRASAYGRGYATGLEDARDLTDFPTNVFVIIPDAQAPTAPRQIRQSDHDALQRGWDRMMKGKGLIVDGPTVSVNGSDVNLGARFRELLRGGLADSPFIRNLFLEIVNDDAHPVTIHVVHDAVGILIDGFQFNPNLDLRTTPLPHRGHHTIDIDDFDQCPRVSGNPRNFVMLRHQNLVHGLREARQGVLFAGAGNAYPSSHLRATADENLFRQEQGQIGTFHVGATVQDTPPVQTPTGPGTEDWRWDFLDNGAVAFFETWHIATDAATGKRRITSIDYSP
jgi:hypothetical protein